MPGSFQREHRAEHRARGASRGRPRALGGDGGVRGSAEPWHCGGAVSLQTLPCHLLGVGVLGGGSRQQQRMKSHCPPPPRGLSAPIPRALLTPATSPGIKCAARGPGRQRQARGVNTNNGAVRSPQTFPHICSHLTWELLTLCAHRAGTRGGSEVPLPRPPSGLCEAGGDAGV